MDSSSLDLQARARQCAKQTVELRPYQLAALDRTRAAIRAGHRRVLLVAPTGSGKTTVASEMIRSATARSRRTLFLAHRRELLDQCHTRLQEFGVSSSIVRANDSRLDADQPVQVASVQTLVRRLANFGADAFDLVVVDEAHHVRANSYSSILSHFAQASAVIGLTATPVRADGKGLADAFDTLVEAASLRSLIELGFLVQPRMFTSPAIDLAGVHRRGDYILAELGERMNSEKLVGNIVEEWQRLAHDRLTVVFATTVAHSQSVAQSFREAGVRAEHLDGEMSDGDRDEVLDRVRSGETQVIVNCQILTEGWDMPAIACCVLARPTKSLALYLQMAGRVLRPAPGKSDCILLDHGNAFSEHGAVDRDRRWTLTGDKPATDFESEAPAKRCPECGFVVLTAVSACPECGHVFVTPRWSGREAACQLVEAKQSTTEKREAFFAIVEDVRRARRRDGSPYKLTAALAKYRDQFGHWPRWTWQREAGIR